MRYSDYGKEKSVLADIAEVITRPGERNELIIKHKMAKLLGSPSQLKVLQNKLFLHKI